MRWPGGCAGPAASAGARRATGGQLSPAGPSPFPHLQDPARAAMGIGNGGSGLPRPGAGEGGHPPRELLLELRGQAPAAAGNERRHSMFAMPGRRAAYKSGWVGRLPLLGEAAILGARSAPILWWMAHKRLGMAHCGAGGQDGMPPPMHAARMAGGGSGSWRRRCSTYPSGGQSRRSGVEDATAGRGA